MHDENAPPPGPDLAAGVPLEQVPATGVLLGHVGNDAVLLAKLEDGLFAVSGTCTHYGGPLVEGLVVDGEVRCPWHHACFSLRTGAALSAPAFAPLQAWRVELVDGLLHVHARVTEEDAAPAEPASIAHAGYREQRIVVVGGGAAGFAAVERLRNLGFSGPLALLSADRDAPCDRPNLSKDYLAGTAPEDWIPLQPAEFYRDHRIDLRLGHDVASIDTAAGEVLARNGERHRYDALLLATGAEPVRLATPGFDRDNVFALRSLADARAIIAAATNARSVVILGASFIGLEAASALRARGLSVHVVARGPLPMERTLGPDLGTLLLRLHREHGVEFHLQRTTTGFDGQTVTLDDGTRIQTDLVVVGIGVRPRTALAEAAGLAVRDGILVDACLRTSHPSIFAAGDVARYRSGEAELRVEHWVHAQRQGQVAAANMLGLAEAFDAVPFFWTHHYGVELRHVGVADGWDETRIDGSPDAFDCSVRYFRGGRLVAATTIGRDRENLEIEAGLHRQPPTNAASEPVTA